MKLAIALSLLLSSTGSASAFVGLQAPTVKPFTVLEASKKGNNGLVASASAAAVGLTVASQVASASFTSLEQKASMLPAHVLIAKAPEEMVSEPVDLSMPEYKMQNKVLDTIGRLRMSMPGSSNNAGEITQTQTVASGAYHPEKGYESLDMSMPQYKIENSDLPSFGPKSFNKNNNKFVASGAYHPEKGYESLDMSMPRYKIENSELPTFGPKSSNKFVASGAYHPEKGYESLDMSMPRYKIENSELPTFGPKSSNKFVASGAYHPEKGYESLDMSMPKYNIENSDLPDKMFMPGSKHDDAAKA